MQNVIVKSKEEEEVKKKKQFSRVPLHHNEHKLVLVHPQLKIILNFNIMFDEVIQKREKKILIRKTYSIERFKCSIYCSAVLFYVVEQIFMGKMFL